MKDYFPAVLLVVSIWLGSQVLLQAMKERLPPAQALRFSPASPMVLSRAAAFEFAEDRFDTAEEFARAALVKTPFDVRALRVLGLVNAKEGRDVIANEMLTLAGNWSLRDDPSHAWLVEYRLSRGEYGSAFAHADTLARRRDDLRPGLFRFFSLAATEDPRSIPSLAALLSRAPPWRDDYTNSLYLTEDGHRIAATMAIALKDSPHPFSTDELGVLYRQLMSRGWMSLMAQVRREVNIPSHALRIVNGGFEQPSAPRPYDWEFASAAGVSGEMIAPDDLDDSALRVQYDSRSSDPVIEQLLELKPGRYDFSGQVRRERGSSTARLTWQISCYTSREVIAEAEPPPAPPESAEPAWRTFSTEFAVPAQACEAQWIRLAPRPGLERGSMVVWYDRFAISPSTPVSSSTRLRP